MRSQVSNRRLSFVPMIERPGQVMQTLIESGYRIPEEVRIVGIDDVQYASLLMVPLATVHQPCREIGVAAVAAMLERIASPEMPRGDILLDFTLALRESSGFSLSSS
jgi:GntR family transcriptional regulator of arabinose operon